MAKKATRQFISLSEGEKNYAMSRAVVQGDWCFVSGTVGYNYADGSLPESAAQQAQNTFTNIMKALEAAELDDEVATEVANEQRDEAFSRLGDFIDPEAPNIMKVNSFDLENEIPVKEAIFALDYVDHDFFVFKNAETGKPTVIYKRNAGGVGLIECA